MDYLNEHGGGGNETGNVNGGDWIHNDGQDCETETETAFDMATDCEFCSSHIHGRGLVRGHAICLDQLL